MTTNNPIIVAIDGPSGSGKSSVAKAVAAHFGIAYLDTGAMYRLVTWAAIEAGICLDSHEAVLDFARNLPLEVPLDPQNQIWLWNGKDVTTSLRSSDISKQVSKVACNVELRKILAEKQREIILESASDTPSFALRPGIVAEGRDITTVVAPFADTRILLTASAQVRVSRRALENSGVVNEQSLSETKDEVLLRDQKDSSVVDFLSSAPGVIEIDSTDINLDEVIAKVVELVEETESDQQRLAALKIGLTDYELEDEDKLLLDEQWQEENNDKELGGIPVLAIVGRPNVGKSTLVNRILGRRAAVVQDTPGVTRDRVHYQAQWSGKDFTLVDTGGWEVDVAGIDAAVAAQAEFAIDQSDAIMFVVDATVGITDTDERLVKLLRKKNKPVLLVANKVDSNLQESDAAVFWGLGLDQPWPVSALHGRGTGDVLEAAMKILPKVSKVAQNRPQNGPRRIALVGRPNVGKSSLINKIAGEERVVTNEIAGTTRDPVDEIINIAGKDFVFVDTAGVRRRVHQTSGADYYASLRTQAAIEKAELGLVLVDASEPLAEQDVRVIGQVVEAGRAIVLAFNKWDLVDEERQQQFKREVEKDIAHLSWAPQFNVSAKTGWHTNRIVKHIERALLSWDMRIPTGKINSFLGEVVAAHPHPVRGGKQPRILFATQISNRPPRFVLFASGFIDPTYRRFIENRIRETFGFEGTPIEISVRVRERRRR